MHSHTDQTTGTLPVKSEILNTNFDISSLEVVDGFVNLTKLAASQGKDIREFSKLKSTKAFLSALEEGAGNSTHLKIVDGVGTFGTREIALKVAQWISPKFEVWCMKKLDTLLQTGKVELEKAVVAENALTHSTEEEQANQLVAQVMGMSKFELAKNLIEQLEQKEQLQLNYQQQAKVVEELKPKAEFANQVNESKGLITLSNFAKIIGTGQNRLFSWMREEKFLMDDNIPYQEFIDRGYFEVKERAYKDKYDRERISFRTFITGKGQLYFANKYDL